MNIQHTLTYLFEALAVVGFTSIFISYLGDIIPRYALAELKDEVTVLQNPPLRSLLDVD